MKKLISILVLASMIVHGLGRLGMISYLYENRHKMAYSLGLTTERMIAVCKGDYFQQSKLVLQPVSGKSSPVALMTAREIVPGSPPAIQPVPVLSFESIARNTVIYCAREYDTPHSCIFHPPGPRS